MSKSKSFVKYLKKINTSTNNLLEKNLNKLKLTNILNLVRSNKIFLEAANPSYEPIILNKEEVVIQGKLLAVWRKV